MTVCFGSIAPLQISNGSLRRLMLDYAFAVDGKLFSTGQRMQALPFTGQLNYNGIRSTLEGSFTTKESWSNAFGVKHLTIKTMSLGYVGNVWSVDMGMRACILLSLYIWRSWTILEQFVKRAGNDPNSRFSIRLLPFFFLSFFLSFLLSFFLSFFPSFLLSFFLSFFLSFLLSVYHGYMHGVCLSVNHSRTCVQCLSVSDSRAYMYYFCL